MFRPGKTAQERAPLQLPVMDRSSVLDACRKLNARDIATARRQRYFPIVRQGRLTWHAAVDQLSAEDARAAGHRVVAFARNQDLVDALQAVCEVAALRQARDRLRLSSPWLSAAKRVTRSQAIVFCMTAAMLAGASFWNTGILAAALCILAGTVFLSVSALRIFSLTAPKETTAPHHGALPDTALPVYTVLVPLFREHAMAEQIVGALSALDYPYDKLDIKLISEESDAPMRRYLQSLGLEQPFEILTVPHAMPQTKPKALNYALQFARGEYVVVFDAEDIPERDQLRLAATQFHRAPATVACLQAKLAYYNAGENWLTRQFAIEYASLFDLLLPALSRARLPFPLGGTSNHFRIDALSAAGAWDPFNVTEDADLGFRLARLGWRAEILNSTTYEEASCHFGNWQRQRARWLKGWLQTWLVHMRHPLQLAEEFGWRGLLVSQATMAGILVAALTHPIFLAGLLHALLSGQFLAQANTPGQAILAGLSLTVLVSGYWATMAAGLAAMARRNLRFSPVVILGMPVYWLLISLAGWLALWQFITKPFHWNKTDHGLSRLFDPNRRPERGGYGIRSRRRFRK